MKTIKKTIKVVIPEDVKVNIKERIVDVEGPRGKITKSFRHASVELINDGNTVEVTIWFGDRRKNALVGTISSHIKNMIDGVRLGFEYKMKAAYSHFPINMIISDDKKHLEIKNFLGEKYIRKIDALEGVTFHTGGKDELIIQGNDIESVSKTSALVYQSTLVKNKDIRKFLDGIYVISRGNVVVN